MARAYNVIDSDGHILEPLTLWDEYIDPAFRDRAPKVVIDTDGKQRLLIEEQVLGSRQGMGGLGGVGARQGAVSAETMSYEEGRPGGFDPHKRIRTWISTASMPPSSIRAWASSPARCTTRRSQGRCVARTTGG